MIPFDREDTRGVHVVGKGLILSASPAPCERRGRFRNAISKPTIFFVLASIESLCRPISATEKSSLKPGDLVKNRVSGSIAVVRGKGRKLMRSHPDYVQVVSRRQSGVTEDEMLYSVWWMKNVERA